MISTNTVALPKKFSIKSWSLLGTFCPQYMDIHIKVYFHHTGCPKNEKMPWYGLKIEINDFNQYNCSPEKVCLYEVEFFGCLLSQILRYTISKCIFTKQDVLKMENAIKLAKNWNIWHQSIWLLSRKSFLIWGGALLEAFCPKYLNILFQSVFSLYRMS